MPKQPDCKWAQRPDKIMLTLNVPNLDPAKSDIKVRVAPRRSDDVHNTPVRAKSQKKTNRSEKTGVSDQDAGDLRLLDTHAQVTETSFSFKADDYELQFDFFGAVDSENASWKVGARDVAFVLPRKESGDYWDKLQKGLHFDVAPVYSLNGPGRDGDSPMWWAWKQQQ